MPYPGELGLADLCSNSIAVGGKIRELFLEIYDNGNGSFLKKSVDWGESGDIVFYMTTISVCSNEMPVIYSERPDVGRDFLRIEVPNGWDDVKVLARKVLKYDGRRFTFTGWNSDRNECFFCAPHGGSAKVAVIE